MQNHRWLDEDPETGLLTFHDFDEWQLRIRKPSDWPEEIKKRVQRHRERKRNRDENQEIEGEVEVTPGNALPPCPACGADVRFIEGSKGEFYGCTAYPTCSWKSGAPPPEPKPPWTPSEADRAEIDKAHGGLRAVS